MARGIVALFVVLALVPGCGNNSECSNSIVGKWTCGGYVWELASDSTWTVGLPKERDGGSTAPNVVGTYTVDGNKVTMTDTGGTNACEPAEGSGVYTFSVDCDRLTFTLVADNCDGRKQGMLCSPFMRQ